MHIARPIRFVLAALVTLAIAAPSIAEVNLPAVFAEHMVLQRDQTVPVWGTAEPNQEVQVVIDGATAKSTADTDGKWRVDFAPHAAGGPFELVVEAGDSRKQIDDVYFGEVWVCSGQSNMGWPLKASANADKEIAESDHPMIRFFQVPLVPSAEPKEDCEGKWIVCNPETTSGISAVGYFFARELQKELNVPVGMLQSAWGGTLADAWTSREALEANELLKPIVERASELERPQDRAGHLYNGMLTPIIPYGIHGAIWYQGESNVRRADQYATLFPAMIADWRARWGQGDFPFYFVQLAPFHYDRHGDSNLLPELWDAQVKTLERVPKTGMAVTTDITNIDDIHPKNKQDVGKRLALWALAQEYGDKDRVYSGPLYDSVTIEDGKATVHFSNVGGGLKTRDGNAPTDFTIAGADETFHPAQAKIDGDTVVVWSDDVPRPVAVRFGWTNVAEPNLTNAEGLPASPFRTDAWRLKTHGEL